VLLTGPLYHIYKIASAIHLTQNLTERYPDKKFIPVFVIGGEDHDWEEVNHFHLFGKKWNWEREASGPVGRLDLENLDSVILSIEEAVKNAPFGEALIQMLRESLKKATSYSEFHQALIISLFQRHGLLVLNMDDPDLKRAFIPVMEKEIITRFSEQTVIPTQEKIMEAGFKPQAYCRPVNLFYMSEGLRERIDPDGDGFRFVDRDIVWDKKQILGELHAHPERFSPNVIMRPLYQEFILPNVAFIGGGGEIGYWLERKTQFEAAGIYFPMLIRRNSLLQIDPTTAHQIDKADLKWEDFFDDYDTIVKGYLQRHSQTDLTFDEEEKLIHDAYDSLAQKAENLDPTLAKAIRADQQKHLKSFEQLGSRLIRTEKQHQETNVKRIEKIKEKLFPQGGLQERHDNFITYYTQYGDEWITDMIRLCDPMEGKFMVVLQER
jgi:bacillithiol biosynthesis cysteine-adding enzyme BshC